jgi:hypothetical protein
MPALTSDSSACSESEAGPMVATILALRIIINFLLHL